MSACFVSKHSQCLSYFFFFLYCFFLCIYDGGSGYDGFDVCVYDNGSGYDGVGGYGFLSLFHTFTKVQFILSNAVIIMTFDQK